LDTAAKKEHDMTRQHVSPRSVFSIGILVLLFLAGCGQEAPPRPVQSRDQLLSLRNKYDENAQTVGREITERNLERIKAEHDDFIAGRAKSEPVVDLLVISGGGDWGAFGAGVLKGWGTVRGDLARPREFDAVTGVSTGALIAPFAFLGDDASIDKVVTMYRHPREDWVKPRGLLTFITSGESYAEIPGLEHDLDASLDQQTLERIADGGSTGRLLVVNTTNVDMQEAHAFDVTTEARHAVETGDKTRVAQILLASSAIPAAFPARTIDGELYVDGSITANIIYGGRSKDDDGFVSQWLEKYPDAPLPKIRYWVIFNNKLRWTPQTVQPTWKSILGPTMTAGTRAATVNAMRLLFARAEIARLKHHADVQVRFVAVPDNWQPPNDKTFDKDTMNALADLGEKLGADPSSWQTDPP
jgi:hypothetical protein